MSGVQTITVTADDGAQRLDRWFRRRFPHVPQGRIEKMCRKGEIRVDGGRVKAADRIAPGQTIRVPPLPDAAAPPAALSPDISEADAAMIRAAVIYSDEHIIAINKPPGLPSQGGSGLKRHVDGLAEALREGRADKPRLVHRLDKDTSGILLLARSAAAAGPLAKRLRDRATRKIYWAAVAGVPKPAMGTIRLGLVKAGGQAERMRCVHPDAIAATPGAKTAVTDYAVLAALAKRCAWVALVPVTGRTHQLRAHMAELGHPVVGDGKYAEASHEVRGGGSGAHLGGEISRKLHLHARHLALTHPMTGAPLRLTAPLPAHMARTWAAFDWQAGEVPEDPFEAVS